MKLYIHSNADSKLGLNSSIPTEEDIHNGNAEYGGIPVIYKPGMSAEARNMTTVIYIGSKFFECPESIQRHILNHEVAHNYADDLMREHTADWNQFCNIFIREGHYPESSSGYKQGKRTYWEGLYGDIGSIALSETLTRAITEYLDDPYRLKSRSAEAYNVIKEFIERKF